MSQLLTLLFLLIGTYAALTAVHLVWPGRLRSPSLRGRISLAALFIVTGVSHFAMPAEMASLLPSFIPQRIALVYVTGVLELLGAIGLLIPGLERLASVALILFLLAVLPANIYGAFAAVSFGGHGLGPIYLLARIPFQLFLMGWAYYFGIRALPSTAGAAGGAAADSAAAH